MLTVRLNADGVIELSGRFDASQAVRAQEFFSGVEDSRVVDLARLEYISSAGLGVLLRAQKRLMGTGGALTLINVNSHIGDIFRYSGFDQIFEIRAATDPSAR